MANKARDIRTALGSSLRAEESRVADRKLDRFARAEAVIEAAREGKAANNAEPIAVEHQRVIRDSFSLPASDYGLISTLRNRGLKAGVHATKSELVRAGLRVLVQMTDAQFVSAIQTVEKIKTGRPSGSTIV
jgi:hypothetical protein